MIYLLRRQKQVDSKSVVGELIMVELIVIIISFTNLYERLTLDEHRTTMIYLIKRNNNNQIATMKTMWLWVKSHLENIVVVGYGLSRTNKAIRIRLVFYKFQNTYITQKLLYMVLAGFNTSLLHNLHEYPH